MKTPDSPATNQNEGIKSAIGQLFNRTIKGDKMQEVGELRELGNIILGSEASNIQENIGFDSYEVVRFILDANADPKNKMKVLALQRVVELLPAVHPLNKVLDRIRGTSS